MFEHSVKVPRLYKTAAKIAKKVQDDGGSIKGLVFQERHSIKALYALVAETLKYSKQIDFLLKKSELLTKEERLDPWLARILITELLWGKKTLSGECKPIKTILAYQQIFNAFSADVHEQQISRVKIPRYVRINTIKLPTNEAIEGFRDEEWMLCKFFHSQDYNGYLQQIANLEDGQFMVDIHIKDLLVFPSSMQFYRHEGYRNGMLILQDKASCLSVQILNPPKGSTVLDMCAAPGMKTTQLAALIENEGTVYAVERDIKRMETLNKLVESSGATCVKTLNRDVLTITSNDIPGVEYILVDPSCSGSGIVNRIESDTNGQQQPRLEKLAGFQIKILKHALKSFPDVKRIVYSTCSIYPQENEAVIQEVISQTTKFKLVSAQKLLNGPWLNFGSPDYGEIGNMCLYTKTEDDLTNGFFVAVFERLEEGEENKLKIEKKLDVEVKPKRKKGYRVNIDMVNQEELKNDVVVFEENNGKSKKKKGYKINLGDLTEITQMECEIEMKIEINDTDTSKKKKKKKRNEAIEKTDENLEDSSICVKKKKKKQFEEVHSIDEGIIIDEPKIKKKKKSNKSVENYDVPQLSDDAIELGDELVKKKKKSKRKKEMKI